MLNRLGFELAERQRFARFLTQLSPTLPPASRLEVQRKSISFDKDAKMKEYRDLEKLVTEWFAQGTGIELVSRRSPRRLRVANHFD